MGIQGAIFDASLTEILLSQTAESLVSSTDQIIHEDQT